MKHCKRVFRDRHGARISLYCDIVPPWSHLCSNFVVYLSQTILGLRANWAAKILTEATRSLIWCPGFSKPMSGSLTVRATILWFSKCIPLYTTCSSGLCTCFLWLKCFSASPMIFHPSFPASKSELLLLQRRQRPLWDMAVVPADCWPHCCHTKLLLPRMHGCTGPHWIHRSTSFSEHRLKAFNPLCRRLNILEVSICLSYLCAIYFQCLQEQSQCIHWWWDCRSCHDGLRPPLLRIAWSIVLHFHGSLNLPQALQILDGANSRTIMVKDCLPIWPNTQPNGTACKHSTRWTRNSNPAPQEAH